MEMDKYLQNIIALFFIVTLSLKLEKAGILILGSTHMFEHEGLNSDERRNFNWFSMTNLFDLFCGVFHRDQFLFE